MAQPINLWHSDLWKISFSNIPSVKNPDELYLFNNFVKSVSFPEYGIDLDDTNLFIGYRDNQPIGHKLNTDHVILQVEFKIVENFKNYLYLFHWLQNTKYGQNIDTASGNLKDYVTKSIALTLFDNKKRTLGYFNFDECNLVNITAIPMSYGTGEEVTFQANFNYNQILWNPADIPECES